MILRKYITLVPEVPMTLSALRPALTITICDWQGSERMYQSMGYVVV
jgi:hypothetical protein